MSSVIAVILCVLLGTAFCALILLCVAMFMMAKIMQEESWENSPEGKGCSDDEGEED